MRDYWGQWAEAKARLERSSTRSIVTYLVDHPTDFRGAFARLRREFRTLYFSAFQSHLWNLMLARWIERSTEPDQRVSIELEGRSLPVPAPAHQRAGAGAQRIAPAVAVVARAYCRPDRWARSFKRCSKSFSSNGPTSG